VSVTETAGEGPALAPVDFVVLEFKDFTPTGEGLAILLDLVDRGIIRILDLKVIKHNDDGVVVGLTAEDISEMGVHSLDMFIGASAGLFSNEDFDAVGELLSPGALGVAILFENTWAAPFVGAVLRHGGEVIATGRVTVNELLAALEASEK
jgi:hypothetical protein